LRVYFWETEQEALMQSSRSFALVVALCALSVAPPSFAAPVIQAGAWERKMDDGAVRRLRQTSDRSFNQATIAKIIALAGAPCTVSPVRTLGSITTLSNSCQIAGGALVTSTTINALGPDASSTQSQWRYSGGPRAMADQNITVVSRRVGSCQPSDPNRPGSWFSPKPL